jgi:hypothetical protein
MLASGEWQPPTSGTQRGIYVAALLADMQVDSATLAKHAQLPASDVEPVSDAEDSTKILAVLGQYGLFFICRCKWLCLTF